MGHTEEALVNLGRAQEMASQASVEHHLRLAHAHAAIATVEALDAVQALLQTMIEKLDHVDAVVTVSNETGA